MGRDEPVQIPDRLDAQGMRCDVDQDRADIDSVDQAPLHGRTHGHGQVGFNLRVHGSAQPLFQKLVDQRGACCPSDQNNLVDLGGLQFSVGQGFVETAQSLDQERVNQLLVLGSDDLHAQVQGHVILAGNEFFLDRRDCLERESFLGFLHGVEQSRPGVRRLAEIDRVLLAECIADMIKQELIEVVAAELGIAVAGEDLHDALLDLCHGDIEGPASQVIDEKSFSVPRMRVVRQDGCRRFVDDANDVQPGKLTRLASGLALAVVEEGGHGDHGPGDRIPQRLFGSILERPQDDRRDFLGAVFLVAQRDRGFLPHLSLDRPDGPFRRQRILVAGRLADQQTALGVKPYDRGEDRIAVLLEDDGLTVADDRDLAVGGSQVDADDGFHGAFSFTPFRARLSGIRCLPMVRGQWRAAGRGPLRHRVPRDLRFSGREPPGPRPGGGRGPSRCILSAALR